MVKHKSLYFLYFTMYATLKQHIPIVYYKSEIVEFYLNLLYLCLLWILWFFERFFFLLQYLPIKITPIYKSFCFGLQSNVLILGCYYMPGGRHSTVFKCSTTRQQKGFFVHQVFILIFLSFSFVQLKINIVDSEQKRIHKIFKNLKN